MAGVVAEVAIALFVAGTIWLNVKDARRQRRLAASRSSMDEDAFAGAMASRGVREDTARFIWAQVRYHYRSPLRPDPDRLVGTFRIDADDLSDIAFEYEREFGCWVGDHPLPCSSDPSLAAYARALDSVSGRR